MLLEDFVNRKLTSFQTSFDSWQDAIRGSGENLIKQGYIDDRYVQAVIACVEKYGPYIVIAPDIAMPHSTEKADGVYKTAISFMKVETPVVFDPNDSEKNARLFFMLAAEDHEAHLKNMMELSEMLMNEDLVSDLLKAKNDNDLLAIANKYSER